MGMGQTVLSNTAVQYSWAIQLGNRQPVATCNQLQLIAQLGSARPQCSPRHPLHKPLHPHTHMDLEGRRFESEVMRAFLPFTYVCNLSSSFCHQCVGTCMCALWKRIEVVHERGIDEEGGFAVRWQGLFSDMTVSTKILPPPQSTKSRNSNSSGRIQIKSKSQFKFEPRGTEESKFLHLVDLGGVAMSVESIIHISRYKFRDVTGSTEIATPTIHQIQNLDSSVSRGTNSKWDFDLNWICTKIFEFLD